MMAIRSFFMLMRKSNAVYDKYCRKVIDQWGLNSTSFQVIMFVANNPQDNTARDICRLRGMKTGIVSVAIEQLCAEGLLRRENDLLDRRIQRLYPTEKAQPLIEDGRQVQYRFFHQLQQAMTPEEFELYLHLTMKLKNTIEEMDQDA